MNKTELLESFYEEITSYTDWMNTTLYESERNKEEAVLCLAHILGVVETFKSLMGKIEGDRPLTAQEIVFGVRSKKG